MAPGLQVAVNVEQRIACGQPDKGSTAYSPPTETVAPLVGNIGKPEWGDDPHFCNFAARAVSDTDRATVMIRGGAAKVWQTDRPVPVTDTYDTVSTAYRRAMTRARTQSGALEMRSG